MDPADAEGGEAGTAVGVSLALSIVNDSSLATTDRDLLVATGGAASFLSSAISASESRAKASAKGADNQTDNSGKTVKQGPLPLSVEPVPPAGIRIAAQVDGRKIQLDVPPSPSGLVSVEILRLTQP